MLHLLIILTSSQVKVLNKSSFLHSSWCCLWTYEDSAESSRNRNVMEDFHCYAEQFLHMFLFVCGVFPIATDYRFTWKLFYDYFVNKSSSVVSLMARLLLFFCDLRHIHPLWMLQEFVIIARCIIHRAAKPLSFHLEMCMHKWIKSGI